MRQSKSRYSKRELATPCKKEKQFACIVHAIVFRILPMLVTSKQKRIAELVAKKFSNEEIAVKLGNTEGAIEQHLVKLFKRHGLKSREELAAKVGQLVVGDLRRGGQRDSRRTF